MRTRFFFFPKCWFLSLLKWLDFVNLTNSRNDLMQQDADAPKALSITRETTRHTPESSLLISWWGLRSVLALSILSNRKALTMRLEFPLKEQTSDKEGKLVKYFQTYISHSNLSLEKDASVDLRHLGVWGWINEYGEVTPKQCPTCRTGIHILCWSPPTYQFGRKSSYLMVSFLPMGDTVACWIMGRSATSRNSNSRHGRAGTDPVWFASLLPYIKWDFEIRESTCFNPLQPNTFPWHLGPAQGAIHPTI